MTAAVLEEDGSISIIPKEGTTVRPRAQVAFKQPVMDVLGALDLASAQRILAQQLRSRP